MTVFGMDEHMAFAKKKNKTAAIAFTAATAASIALLCALWAAGAIDGAAAARWSAAAAFICATFLMAMWIGAAMDRSVVKKAYKEGEEVAGELRTIKEPDGDTLFLVREDGTSYIVRGIDDLGALGGEGAIARAYAVGNDCAVCQAKGMA